MTDGQSKLNPEEHVKVQDWIKGHWKNYSCMLCGDNHWEIGNVLAQAPMFSGGNIIVGGVVYPLIVLTCAKCGNTILLNAIKVGIVPIKKEGGNDIQQPS